MSTPDSNNGDCTCNNSHSDPQKNFCRSVDRYFPFSAEELTIYHKLRCLIQEATCVKKKLKEIEALGVPPPSLLAEKLNCMDHLTRLRREWASWKERSAEAATRRMMAFGHIDPDGTGFPGGCEDSCPLDDYPNLSP